MVVGHSRATSGSGMIMMVGIKEGEYTQLQLR